MRVISVVAIAILLVGVSGCAVKLCVVDSSCPQIHYLSPDGLHANPAFSHVVVTHGDAMTVHVGGQNAVDSGGAIVGKGDIAVQSVQVAKNIKTALEAGGATLDDVIKWNIFIVEGQSIGPAYAAFQAEWGHSMSPPLVTVVLVSGLAHPDFLLEVNGVAVVSP